jgi:methylmalonyl-CoA/ethylmalonyl-CoA epimerase
MRTAVADAGGIDVELLEPGPEPSPYREFLENHSEGLHHLMLAPSSALETRVDRGLPVLMQGKVGSSAEHAYFDATGPLKLILEAMHRYAEPTSVALG